YFHYLNNIKLFVKYFLGTVVVLDLVPFITGEIIYFIKVDQHEIVIFVFILIYCLAYFGATLACACFLPKPHRLRFALLIMILGIIQRFVMMIHRLMDNSDFRPRIVGISVLVSFATGTAAAIWFLYWRKKKQEIQDANSLQKTP
ncbi:MAG: hypothetical protein ACKOLA_03960, partial [Spartobacteria bacterium]